MDLISRKKYNSAFPNMNEILSAVLHEIKKQTNKQKKTFTQTHIQSGATGIYDRDYMFIKIATK